MKIALLQMNGGTDPAANTRVLVNAISEAARGGATMLFTPEMSNLIDRDRARAARSIVAEADDLTLDDVRIAAKKNGIWVHLGSLALTGPDGRNVNRGFVIDPDGQVRARYDKLHLFDVDLASGESWRESAAYAPGKSAVAVDTAIGRLGLSICYDLRFPALFSALSDAGATLLSVPAAFTRPTGAAHWETLLRARAIENGCFVVAAAQCGEHEDGRTTWGHSLVIDPWGEVLLDMGDAPGLAFVEIDGERVEAARARIPVVAHRRPVPPVQLS